MSTKCFSCKKTLYPMEAIGAGENKYHKICFKCSVCSVTLNLKNSQQKGDQVFCTQHVPKDIPTATADRADLNRIKDGPKLATVNQQFRGELVGQKTNVDMEAAGIKNAFSAPKVGTVNEQFRGELVGIKNATSAPKVGTVNEQRTEGRNRHGVGWNQECHLCPKGRNR
eukprot:TRINITY_DN54_c0_g1_i9.p2 TRINITY_DN54_c0_g1~~TRINITY_DN54_c0_g1_i9.p2  ORF type:complete len:169 (+),score=59.04 TRINITY_DN54_c0_g1_i9:236-742(+)